MNECSDKNNFKQDYLTEILLCLQTTYSNSDKNIRKNAEKTLNTYRSIIIQNFPIVIDTLKSTYLSKELSNSLLIYIRNSIVIMNEKNKLSREELINLIKTTISTIIDQSFPKECLKQMNQIFEEVINCTIIEEDESIVNELVSLLHKKIIDNSISPESYSGIGYIFESILCASCVGDSNSKDIIKAEIDCIEIILKNIICIFKSVLVNDQSHLSKISLYANTLKVIYGLLLNISVHSQKTYNNVEYFIKILTTYYVSVALIFIEIQYEDKDLNFIKMKTKIFRFINSLSPLLPNYIIDKEAFDTHTKLIMLCICSLNFKGGLFKNLKNNSNIYLNNYAEQMIVYLSKVGLSPSFKCEFDKVLLDFTKNSLIPLLISDYNEIKEIESNGENYANFMYSLSKKPDGKGLKVTIAKFIESVSKENANYTNFLFEYSITLIQLSIEVFPINQSLYLEKEDYMISQEVNDNQRIETSLLILCIICKMTKKRKLLIKLFDFFRNNFIILTEKMKNCSVIKQRICLFIWVYIKDFLNENIIDATFINNICEFLLYIILKEDNPIAQCESLQSVKSFIVNSNENNDLTFLLQKFSFEFISYIEKATNPIYFDIIIESLYKISSDVLLLQIMQNLLIRLKSEMSKDVMLYSHKTQKKTKKILNSNYKVIINKCFCIIKTLFKKINFISNNLNEIEKLIYNMIEYMKSNNIINFNDDIISIMLKYIKVSKQLTPCALKFIQYLPQYLIKYKGLELDLFLLLNEYIINSNSVIENNDDYCSSIFKFFKKSISMESYSDSTPILSSWVMQIWFLNSKNIPTKYVIDTIHFTLNILKGLSYKTFRELYFSLTVLLYLSFVNYPKIICNNISFELLVKFLEYIDEVYIFSPYQIKLLIIGICTIIQNDSIVLNFSQFIPPLLSFSIIFLSNLKKFESSLLKKQDINKIKEKLIYSDNEIEEDSEQEIEVSNEEEEKRFENNIYINIGKRIVNNYKNIDEFLFFRESVTLLKEKFQKNFLQWLNLIKDEEKKEFSNIMSTSRITIEDSNDNRIEVPRKIVKIKKSN